MNKHSLKAIGIVVFILVGCVVLWKVSGIIVRKGYSSQSVVSKEAEKSTESNKSEEVSTIEVTTEKEKRLGEIDYDSREVTAKVVDYEGYKNKINKLKSVLPNEDLSNYVSLSTYYYGDYDTYYEDDLKLLLQDYHSLYDYVSNLSDTDLNDMFKKVPDIDLDRIFNKERVDNLSLLDLVGMQQGDYVANLNNLVLVGVIGDRYYVFSNSDDVDRDDYPLLVIDMQDSLVVLKNNNISIHLYKLGGSSYYFAFCSKSAKIVDFNGRTLILYKGV